MSLMSTLDAISRSSQSQLTDPGLIYHPLGVDLKVFLKINQWECQHSFNVAEICLSFNQGFPLQT